MFKQAYAITDYNSYIKNFMMKEVQRTMHNCEVCGKPDPEKPMAFRNKPWCCENHRKIVEKDDSVRKTF